MATARLERSGLEGDLAPRSQSFGQFFRELPGPAKRFWVLVLLTGAAAGIGAVVLVWLLRLVEGVVWPSAAQFFAAVEKAPNWQRVLVPSAGGVLVVLASVLMRRPLGGHGTAGLIEAIWLRSGRIPLLRTLARGVVSIVVVAMGAPLGREGALLQFGSATGSALAQRLRVSADQARLLVACGAAAGIAAAYNVPIGGALFGLEVLLGSFALELFGPIVVACVVATLISRVLIANHPTYVIPHHEILSWSQIAIDLAIAPVLGLASGLYNRTVSGFAELAERLPMKVRFWLPIPAMVGVGVAAIWLPELLGNGYDVVNLTLLGKVPLVLLLVLPLAKMLGTSITSACGVPGGLFTPSLFYGALMGGAVGQLAVLLFPHVPHPEGFALVGMSAILAGTTHASVSSVLIIFELTGSYEVILPLMLASVIAAAVSKWVEPDSLYTAVLHRKNVTVPTPPRPQWLRPLTVRSLMVPGADMVRARTPFDEVVVRLIELPSGSDLYVTTPEGTLIGTLVLDELKGHLPDHSLLQMTVAADVMNTHVTSVNPDMSLSEVSHLFSQTDTERLPVVDARGRLIGTIAKRDVMRHVRF